MRETRYVERQGVTRRETGLTDSDGKDTDGIRKWGRPTRMAKNIGKLVTAYALKSRPKLYQWMHANYAELKPVLTQPRPSWEALAKAAAEDGQLTKDGMPYSRQVAWKTWRQLSQDMEAASVRPGVGGQNAPAHVPTTPASAEPPTASASGPPEHQPSPIIRPDDPPPRFQRKPVVMRGVISPSKE
jgi:hypothetical protein